MKNFFNKLAYKFSIFMQDRYGGDELNRFIIFVGAVFALLSCIPVLWFLYIFALLSILYAAFRFFSKKRYKRQRERGWYIGVRETVLKKFRLIKNMWKNRKTTKYLKCASCKTIIKVPKGKEKIKITCPKCQNTFIKKV